jgi:NADPH-dependent curcumin reductase CurA
MPVNRQIMIAKLPEAKLGPETFTLVEAPMPAPADGEVLVRVLYVSLDAANRAWMRGATYRAAVKVGDVMPGAALAEVVESRAPGFKAGDLVYGDIGWRDYAALSPKELDVVPRTDPLSHQLSVYGVAGLTAYFGLLEVGQPKAGDTVVVSAAAGAVGLFVGQIAKLKGCKVVGIAGGKAKCDTLVTEYGFDAAVDYKAGPIYRDLMAATGGGPDVFFDNVGGEVFESVVFAMKPFGRIACCGAVAFYDATNEQLARGVRGVPGLFVTKRLSMKGFVVMDFYRNGAREKALDELQGWVQSGKIKVREDIMHGLESLPAALIGLLAGENVGKRMVKVA